MGHHQEWHNSRIQMVLLGSDYSSFVSSRSISNQAFPLWWRVVPSSSLRFTFSGKEKGTPSQQFQKRCHVSIPDQIANWFKTKAYVLYSWVRCAAQVNLIDGELERKWFSRRRIEVLLSEERMGAVWSGKNNKYLLQWPLEKAFL